MVSNSGNQPGFVVSLKHGSNQAKLPTPYLERHDYKIDGGKSVLLPFFFPNFIESQAGEGLILHYLDHRSVKHTVSVTIPKDIR
jgi:hypothetical protein